MNLYTLHNLLGAGAPPHLRSFRRPFFCLFSFQILQEEFGQGLHALALDTKAPSEITTK